MTYKSTAICLMLIYGLPGSGKSTLCAAFADPTNAMVGQLLPLSHYCNARMPNRGTHRSIFMEESAEWSLHVSKEAALLLSQLLAALKVEASDDVWPDVTAALLPPYQATVKSKIVHVAMDTYTTPVEDTQAVFNATHWKEGRQQAYAKVEETIQQIIGVRGPEAQVDPLESLDASDLDDFDSCVILVEDTFHYKSMRKKYFALAKRYNCSFHQILLETPLQLCLERNNNRSFASQIPVNVMLKNAMLHVQQNKADLEDSKEFVFQKRYFYGRHKWGTKWEGSDGCYSWVLNGLLPLDWKIFYILCGMVFYSHWFWPPIPYYCSKDEKLLEQIQLSDSYIMCAEAFEKQLRQIVSDVLAQIPDSMKPTKSILAQKWSLIKKEKMQTYYAEARKHRAQQGTIHESPDWFQATINRQFQHFREQCEADIREILLC